MCGLCGFFVQSEASGAEMQAAIDAMTAALAHRGPDAGGTQCRRDGGYHIGLGHRRLSVIDLSDRASQPMCNEDGGRWLVYNGEIYNYKALTRDLRAAGHVFRSASDSEAVLHQYEQDGTACVEKLDGMFAFAVVDILRRTVFLARDRLGIKPLFYSMVPGGIVFASEIKSIVRFPGISCKPLSSAIDAYLALGYVPGPQTIFCDIRALGPGQWLVWRDGRVEVQRYWSALRRGPVLDESMDTLADRLDSLLNDAVCSHLAADVPVGAFLSGGLDSSLVAAIAARHMREPLHTYTIGFAGGGDEREYGRIVAAHIGSVHHERMAEPDLVSHLPRFVRHLEQPLFDNSVIPTFAVSALAREHGKVVVSGDGGDEPFGGYGWTRAAASIPGAGLRLNTRQWEWLYRTGWVGFGRRGLFDVAVSGMDRYLRRITVPKAFRHWLYTREFRESLDGDPCETMRKTIEGFTADTPGERFALADITGYLPEDVLFKVDRMSMANSLEVRVPLLDHRLLEFIFRLPWAMRCRGRHGKVLLRCVAKRYLPESICKPRKQGFTVPVGRWLRGPMGKLAEKVFCSERFASRNIIAPQRACRLMDMHRSGRFELGHRIWSLLVLETWCRVWLDNEPWEHNMEQLFSRENKGRP